jgi:hypothetical protein
LTLDTVKNLGLLYKNPGNHPEAEQMYKWLLQGKETAWGQEHPVLAAVQDIKSDESRENIDSDHGSIISLLTTLLPP